MIHRWRLAIDYKSSHTVQCVALDGKDKPNNVEMARVLIEAGAELNEPLVAAASMDNRAVAELLLDHGAAIDAPWLVTY